MSDTRPAISGLSSGMGPSCMGPGTTMRRGASITTIPGRGRGVSGSGTDTGAEAFSGVPGTRAPGTDIAGLVSRSILFGGTAA